MNDERFDIIITTNEKQKVTYFVNFGEVLPVGTLLKKAYKLGGSYVDYYQVILTPEDIRNLSAISPQFKELKTTYFKTKHKKFSDSLRKRGKMPINVCAESARRATAIDYIKRRLEKIKDEQPT